MGAARIDLDGLIFAINDNGEDVCVAVHDRDGNPKEFFRFKAGHPACSWTYERIAAYCRSVLDKRTAK